METGPRRASLCLLTSVLSCAGGCALVPTTSAYPRDKLDFAETELKMEVSPVSEEVEIRVTFSCVLINAQDDETSRNIQSQRLSRYPSFRFHSSAQIDGILTPGGSKIPWRVEVDPNDPSRKWITVDLGRSLKPGETTRLEIRYTVKPFPDPLSQHWEGGGSLQAGCDFAPRLDVMDRNFPCPRRVSVRIHTREKQTLIAGPGGVAELRRSSDGYLEGEIATADGEVGLNTILWTGYKSLTKVDGVNVYGMYPKNGGRSYALIARRLKESRELLERWIGPLERQVIAIEVPGKSGWSLFPGVVVFPAIASLPQEPVPGSRTLFLAHELAHSYFGNSVSPLGPGGQLLSEGVAEYLGLLILEEIEGKEVLRTHLEDNVRACRESVSYPATLAMLPMGSQATVVAYARGAYIFRMMESRIGREELLSSLQEIWAKYAWKLYPFKEFSGESRLAHAWGKRHEPPSWPQFLESWSTTNGLPRFNLESAKTIRGAAAHGAYRAEVTLMNSGAIGAEIELEFSSHEGQKAKKKVFVEAGQRLQVVENLEWSPIRVTLDPDWLTLQDRGDEISLIFK